MNENFSKENLAHLEVLYKVSVYVRSLGWSVQKKSGLFAKIVSDRNSLDVVLITDIMDAIHNTPNQICKPLCATEEYVRIYYQAFDEKHPKSISLVQTFYECLNAR